MAELIEEIAEKNAVTENAADIERKLHIAALGKEALEIGISKIAISFPLYYIPLINLKQVIAWDMPTIGVGPYGRFDIGLYFNPEFILSLTSSELRAVLQHESMHILMQHLTRGREFGANHNLYNISADLTINPRLEGIPKWGYFPANLKLPDNESAELYYKTLKERREEMKKNLRKQMKGMGMSDEEIDQTFLDSLEGRLMDDHSLWEDMTEEQRDIIAEKIRNISEVAMRAQDARGWGDIPGNVMDQIIAANIPIVNWKREIKFFVNQVISSGTEATRKRPSRRYGYLQPGSKKVYTSKLLVAIDCSGSVSDAELQMFVDEISGIVEHAICHVISFDTTCHGAPQALQRKYSPINIHGRGGTDFSAPIQMANELKYDGLIIMTDGECYFPPAPKCRMVWALSRNSSWAKPPPYGKVINLSEMN